MRGGGGTLHAVTITEDKSASEQTLEDKKDATKDEDREDQITVSGANGKIGDIKVTTTKDGSITIKSDSQGMLANKNVTIQDAAGGTLTITNENKTFGGLKYESDNGKVDVIIKNTTPDGTAAANAAKISGDILGAAGSIEIENGANSEIAGSITGKTGDLTITNAGKISTTGKAITAGAGNLKIDNQAAGEIKVGITTSTGKDSTSLISNQGTIEADITGDAGALTIENSGKISDNSKTITGKAGALNIDNATGGTIAAKITGGAGGVTITNAGTLKTGAIDGKTGALSITNNKGGTIENVIKGGTGTVTIANDGGTITSATINGATNNAGDMTIINSNGGTISSVIDSKAGALSIDNQGDTLSGKITGTTTADKTTSITNAGTITGEIDGKAGTLKIDNSGTLSNKITSGGKGLDITNAAKAEISGVITAAESAAITITNSGNISDTTGIKANKGNLTINNLTGGTIAGDITMDGKEGDLSITNAGNLAKITAGTGNATIQNQAGGKITGDITGSTDAAKTTSVTNAGTLSGKIDGKTGAFTLEQSAGGTIAGLITGGGKESSITNAGTISGGITAGAGALTITNSGSIEGGTTAAAVKITGAAESLTITNLAGGAIAAAIEGSTGANKATTITNAGTISGAIDSKTGSLSIANQTGGNITGAIAGGAATFSLTNDGSVKTLSLKKVTTANATNTITNGANGVINDIKFTEADITATINNAGKINRLEFNQTATVTLGANYNVVVNDKGSYDSSGVLGISGTKSNATFIIAHENAFALSFGENFEAGAVYSLANFIDGSDQEAKIQYAGSTNNVTLNRAHITTTQNIFEIDYVAMADGGTGFTGTVQSNKSIGSLGAVQTTANMNAQIGRVQTLMDGVFDGLATGEIGYSGFQPQPNTDVKMQQASASKVKGGYVMLAAAGSPNAVSPNLTLSQNNKKWVGFVTPYYSASNIKANGFSAAAGTSAGFVGGAARMFDNGMLVGVHLGAESQMAGNVNNEMRSQGGSFMLGASAKIPFANYDFGAIKLTPIVKVQGTGMGAINSYMLTPLQDVTREATGVVGGFSISALAGVDLKTNFGYFVPELGLMQQVVNMPTLEYTGFNSASNNQVINGTSVTPFSLVAQVRYVKDFQVGKVGLYPAIKGGMRYVMVGGNYTTSIFLPAMSANNAWYGTNSIDSFVGVAEVGLGVKFGGNVAINLSYGGEFGSQVTTHNLSLRSGWQF